MAYSRQDLERMVWQEAIKQGVDPTLAVKLAWQESRFNPDARSPAGAIGTMQLMPGTAKDLKVDPEDVAGNIRGGITYLKQQLARFGGRQDLALAAYNAGPGAVQKYGGVPPYKETQQYVQNILGGQAPALEPTQRRAGRDWGEELGFTAAATSATGTEPTSLLPQGDGALAQAGTPEDGASDWAAVLFGEQRPTADGAAGQGQDWASLLFG